MPSHRLERIAEAIREVVSSAVLFEMADPRVKGVTVLGVEVGSDLRNATVYVSLMGTETEQKRTLGALKHGAGFLQAKVAARLQTRSTPVLAFKRDESVKKSIALTKLIDQVAAETAGGGDVEDEPEPDELGNNDEDLGDEDRPT